MHRIRSHFPPGGWILRALTLAVVAQVQAHAAILCQEAASGRDNGCTIPLASPWHISHMHVNVQIILHF